MKLKIGTFNLNNLFSRYNFQGEIDAIKDHKTDLDSKITYKFNKKGTYKLRTYLGKLVTAKESGEVAKIAQRIKSMDLDILAVQEVEDIDTLRTFNAENLAGLYKHLVLIEGNDPRLIDIGLMSKYPIGCVASWQHAVHPKQKDFPIFGRDMLEVDILTANRNKCLVTIYNNHLKSNYVSFRTDPDKGRKLNNEKRFLQSEVIARIIKNRMDKKDRFIILGDMNDSPESHFLHGFTRNRKLRLVNGIQNPQISYSLGRNDREYPHQTWTHRYKPSGAQANYELFDQIWLSPSLADKQKAAWIDRRQRLGGDGSDHDPAWVEIKM